MMIPLDDVEQKITELQTSAQKYLSKEEFVRYNMLTAGDIKTKLRGILESPIHHFSTVNTVYFRSKWGELFDVLNMQETFTLLEIASGAEDMIPQAMSSSYPGSAYFTANMNEKLNTNFLHKTKNLNITLELIRDDAKNLNKHIRPDTLDIIVFQHGVNDVLQAILCEKNGIDTTFSDWMQLLPKMIELVTEHVDKNTFEHTTKSPLLRLMERLLLLLRHDGIIAINHYMFQYDLDLGYPRYLWENFIPIIRPWFTNLKGCKEVRFEKFPEQWWLFLQKDAMAYTGKL